MSGSRADTRLIERWLPITALGIESVRERTPMTPFPAPNRLHVWWARRPLVASRAAVLASLLPADADRERFMHVRGIHGDPIAAKRRIENATREGKRLGAAAYGYPRAFGYTPDEKDRQWIEDNTTGDEVILDPTAGGGSIPFESRRLGLRCLANDLNPVAALIERATVEWPGHFGAALLDDFSTIGARLAKAVSARLDGLFPAEEERECVPDGYLWARTIVCPFCRGLVPLSPNWRLAPDGTGVRLKPNLRSGPGSTDRTCEFEVVESAQQQSEGTIARGDGLCPYDDCGRVIDGGEIKRQAQGGGMGDQLYAVVFKRRVEYRTKAGRMRHEWERGYRAPRPEDDNSDEIAARLVEKLSEWEALDYVPSERFPEVCNDDRPIQYGMPLWRDLFSPRQLLCHGTSVEVFREMLADDRHAGRLDDSLQAAYGYLALTLDTLLNYNNRFGRWDNTISRVRSIFDRHDFAFVSSYAEMAPLVAGVGYDWAIKKTAKCIEELIELIRPGDARSDPQMFEGKQPPPVAVTCRPGDRLDHMESGSVDVVVMDPPYYDNVMYAELSDFFYVWLKRTAGYVLPELFRRTLTDKENEAVANRARHRGIKGAAALAARDYRERMVAIFAECRRVLKSNGLMTLMFSHKATGAWDALTTGLMESGFAINASWPVNTEAGGSLHIKDRAAAKSTVLLVCRPKEENGEDASQDAPVYWEDVEPRVAAAVRRRMDEFSEAGIGGVDLFLASFGPALEEFSRHWPLKRGTPREPPAERKRSRQLQLFEEEWDPYAATPEDALDAARREVQRWRLRQIAHPRPSADLDPATAFVVFAWDTFKAPVFPYDEALHLARSVGIDLDRDVVGRLAEKKSGNLRLWDSAHRAAKGALGPADGSRSMIDAIHHAANIARSRSVSAAQEMLRDGGVERDAGFFVALEALLEVLPPSGRFTGADLKGDLAEAANDFDGLYSLYRLAYTAEIDEPAQLEFWKDLSGD
ncbi:MAG: DUF1156 domain-containing protein [Gammaproteobacteria bacterium]|nr:DUF1156 domain-containing protein [Gammaproteobacteria bacterium]